MRPGFPGRLLGICPIGGVFLIVFVRHLYLSDLFLFFSGCFVCLGLVGSPFSFVVIKL